MSQSVASLSHHAAVLGVGGGLDGTQLVQHLADDDDASPHGAHTRRQRPELAVWESKGPAHQKHVVKERHLGNRHKHTISLIIIIVIMVIFIIIIIISFQFPTSS